MMAIKCTHDKHHPDFDIEESREMSVMQVRRRWPRYEGRCDDCGQLLILYASFAHYLAGDW